MADDKEVKGTRGFVVTTEPDAKSKDFIERLSWYTTSGNISITAILLSHV